jgi:phosphopantetheinyl transferase
MAVATGPMGIDVELVEAHRDVPWAILHPVERTRLEAIPAGDRARAFARLWSVKEAYLKALRWGLTRPPDEIRVDFIDHQNATVDDPYESRSVRQATTVWREAGGSLAALSAVLLRE